MGVYLRKVMLWGILVALGGAGLLFALRERAVLFTVNWEWDAVRPRGYPVMNPFRERGPERVAEAFLGKLAVGDFRELERIPGAQFVEQERRWPIVGWRVGRRDGANLMYWVRRGGGYGELEEAVWIEIGLDGSIRGFDAMY